MSERLKVRADSFVESRPELSLLAPQAFAEQVLESCVAVDCGNWVQPLFSRRSGTWQLCKLEVLYRLNDARRVPFPAFVNFVEASTDQSPNADPKLRRVFCDFAVRSAQYVDDLLMGLGVDLRAALARSHLHFALNVTAKQLGEVLCVPLKNARLLSLEETEYDDEPKDLSALRLKAWCTFEAYSLDDVKPTLAEAMAFTEDGALNYEPPQAPNGQPYKAIPTAYRHDFAFARRFIEDFKVAAAVDSRAQGDLKLDEEFCCYLIGVGHAPFARESMRAWRERHPETSAAVRATGLALVREAVEAGLGVCLEVSFCDGDVQWLLDEVPQLEGRLLKQGGQSGSTAMPLSCIAHDLFAPCVN